MIAKQAACHESKHWARKHQFLVHLLKVSRLPTQITSFNADGVLQQHGRKDALKVTALYNSHQLVLGDFPIWMNECIIDRKLTCQFRVWKPEIQSKLHLYIDQICSSGLTGHLALDLHEFVREDESEIHVKYPLYANISGYPKGPVLKVIIKYLGISNTEPLTDEENDILLVPPLKIPGLHENGLCNTKDVGYAVHDGQSNLASFSQMEGALSEIGEKLKTLVASFKSRDHYQTVDRLAAENDYQSSTTSPVLSSLHTGTSVDSHSEHCTTDSDDIFDSSFDLGHPAYPLTIARPFRATFDTSCRTAKSKQMKTRRQSRQASMEDAFSESSLSQGRKSHPSEHHGHEDCFLCSSEHVLQSYGGLQAHLSRSKTISSRTKSLQLNSLEVNKSRMSMPVIDSEQSTKGGKAEASLVPRKGPGLLKGLFGAVLVAGVSLLGVRNSHISQEQSQSVNAQTNLARTSSNPLSRDVRIEPFSRRRYSFRR